MLVLEVEEVSCFFNFLNMDFPPPCIFLKRISVFKCHRNSCFPSLYYCSKQWDSPAPWLTPLASLLTSLGSCEGLDLNYSQRETWEAELARGEHRAHCHCSPGLWARAATLVVGCYSKAMRLSSGIIPAVLKCLCLIFSLNTHACE